MSEYLAIPNKSEEHKLFEEYGMTNDQVQKDVAIVKKWMMTQPNLPEFPESKNGHYYQIEYYAND